MVDAGDFDVPKKRQAHKRTTKQNRVLSVRAVTKCWLNFLMAQVSPATVVKSWTSLPVGPEAAAAITACS